MLWEPEWRIDISLRMIVLRIEFLHLMPIDLSELSVVLQC